MNEKRFILCQDDLGNYEIRYDDKVFHFLWEVAPILNEQQELIEELHTSDNMGWGRAEKFEKELKQKKIYIKRLEYKVQKFKEMNDEQQATINKVYELLEEADIFSDEATEHDIKAYIELQEFDNKDAYYLACAIKKAIKLLKGDDV